MTSVVMDDHHDNSEHTRKKARQPRLIQYIITDVLHSTIKSYIYALPQLYTRNVSHPMNTFLIISQSKTSDATQPHYVPDLVMFSFLRFFFCFSQRRFEIVVLVVVKSRLYLLTHPFPPQKLILLLDLLHLIK